MDNMISLEFNYRSKTYYALVRTKINDHRREYHITIMNGNLERLLYGHHVIVDEDGVLRSWDGITDSDIAELKQCITQALCEHLQAHAYLN